MTLLDDLRTRRTELRGQLDEILTRAADESRDLTGDELRSHRDTTGQLREVDDRIEQVRDDEVRELRAAAARPALEDSPQGRLLTREQSVTGWARGRGLVTDEHRDLSFGRYLRGIVTGEWDDAEHERALAEGTATAGGHLVPTPLASNVIDLARAQTRVFQAGATTVPMTAASLKLPRLATEGSPSWKAENASVTDADMTFGSLTFTAKTVTRLIKLSVELFEDSDPSVGQVIERSFAAQFALEVDRVALRGSGASNQPLGVLGTSGVILTDHGANGAAIGNYDWLLDAAGAVRGGNFDPNAHVVAPRTVTSLSKLKDSQGNYLSRPDGLLPILPTNQIPADLTVGTSDDTSLIFTADWSQLMVGIRTSFDLRFLGERFMADNLQVGFLAYMRLDVQLAQPAAFVVDRGVRA